MSSLLDDLDKKLTESEPDFNMEKLLGLRTVYLNMIREDSTKLVNFPGDKATVNYKVLEATYSRILKQKLPYDDRIIKQILYRVITTDGINEIYVFGDRIRFEINGDNSQTRYIEDAIANIFDVTSSRFYFGVDEKWINFLVPLINDATKVIFGMETDLTKTLRFNNGRIEYEIPNLRIETNYSFKDIITTKRGQKIKFHVNHEEQLYFFDLEIREKDAVITKSSGKLECLSEKLGTGTQK